MQGEKLWRLQIYSVSGLQRVHQNMTEISSGVIELMAEDDTVAVKKNWGKEKREKS